MKQILEGGQTTSSAEVERLKTQLQQLTVTMETQQQRYMCVTILLLHDPLTSSAYDMITHPLTIVYNLPIKPWSLGNCQQHVCMHITYMYMIYCVCRDNDGTSKVADLKLVCSHGDN